MIAARHAHVWGISHVSTKLRAKALGVLLILRARVGEYFFSIQTQEIVGGGRGGVEGRGASYTCS